LHRRFTTTTVPTVNGIPGLSPIGQQRLQAAGEVPAPTGGLHHRYEALLQQQRQIQEELDRIDPDTRRDLDENIRHEQAVTQLIAQSEPSTPPEYHKAFSSFSRSSRYSTSLASPPGLAVRPNRASTQLTSPSLSFVRAYANGAKNPPNLPSQSVPGSRRHSDDEEEEDYRVSFEQGVHRAAAKPNRNSMPITSYDRSKRNTADMSLGLVNTTGYLFGDEDTKTVKYPQAHTTASPPDTKTYLKVQHTADGFPKLIRSEQTTDNPLASASTALDLASSAHPDQHLATRASRNRISLPPTTLNGNITLAPLDSILASTADNRPNHQNRRSMDVKFSMEPKRPSLTTVASRTYTNGATPSFSTSDLPTLKSMNGETPENGANLNSPPVHPSRVAEEQSATLSRLTSARQSQDLTANVNLMKPDENTDAFAQPMLQGNAAPFGPLSPEHGMPRGFMNQMAAYGQPYFHPYNMQMLGNSFQNMNMGVGNGYGIPPQFPGLMQNNFQAQPAFPNFQSYPQAGPPANSAARITSPPRRATAEEAQQNFTNVKLEQIIGQIYGLCKDQHGCRFLQRKLDERNEQTVQIIFNEVKTHMVELMVDPFGNYLCQKLLESCSDDQRTVLVKNAMPKMTQIALNQHGTRALQKMIEFISRPEQTALIIEALRDDVVVLIQDLNGNHVVQKCLNHLSSEDARFIFEAVGNNCVVVGTHRHGCCVLQRCIDHADGLQKGEMVNHVIANANQLVKDPFGNYVVQYILDLSEPCFTEPLSRAFLPHIVSLSSQKFSSNVIEKCIRCAGPDTKRDIIREIMAPHALEKLLRDGFANYVVQTAMDFADEEVKPAFVERVRNILPTIRTTPHGRRIQSKITEYDNRQATAGTSILSPYESSSAAPVPQPAQPSARSNRHGMIGLPQQWNANNYNFMPYAPAANGYAGAQNGHASADIVAPSPQRGAPGFMLNGGQDFSNVNAYAGQAFNIQGAQAYGHF